MKRMALWAMVVGMAGWTFGQSDCGTLGPLGRQTGLDAATRKDAEETLARGVAWLQAQQVADGRIGSNRHVAVTALALAAARGAAAAITNFEWLGSGAGESGIVFEGLFGWQSNECGVGCVQWRGLPRGIEVAAIQGAGGLGGCLGAAGSA